MARANSHDTALREALENATGSMVRIRYMQRIVRLRVDQARQRTGLEDLLAPALADLDDIGRSAQVAQDQVRAALVQLLGDKDATSIS